MIAVALWSQSERAAAQASVVVPKGCGSEAELHAELARMLGPAAATSAVPKRLHIEARAQGDYALSLELVGESRALHDADCRTLFRTAVVVAAAAIEPALNAQASNAQASDAQPEPMPAAPPVTQESPDPSAQPSPADAPAANPETAPEPQLEPAKPSPRWTAEVALGGGGVVGMAPRLAPLFELSGYALRGTLGLALSVRLATQTEAEPSEGRGVGVSAVGTTLALRYAPVVRLFVEPGLALDRVAGEGLGAVVLGAPAAGLSFGVSLAAGGVVAQLGPIDISLVVSGRYNIVRPSFEIAGFGQVYRVGSFAGSGIVRVGWAFR